MGKPRAYVVALTPKERSRLRGLSRTGQSGARVIRRARPPSPSVGHNQHTRGELSTQRTR